MSFTSPRGQGVELDDSRDGGEQDKSATPDMLAMTWAPRMRRRKGAKDNQKGAPPSTHRGLA